MTGTTIDDAAAASHVAPMTNSETPRRNRARSPISRSQVGAENTRESAAASISTTARGRSRLDPVSAPVMRVLRRRFEQGESEVRDALQQPLELGLVAHASDQRRSSALARERHACKCRTELVAELAFDDHCVFANRDDSSIAPLR
jgi:hypothetical protein